MNENIIKNKSFLKINLKIKKSNVIIILKFYIFSLFFTVSKK